ncbi:MAG: plasmid stabilization protein [Rhizobium sp.]|nr:plasmid stabilization protein [Rhizobium sp.]
MGDLLIRDVPDELKRDLSAIAKVAGRSMSDEAKAMLLREVAARRAAKPVQPSKSAYEELRGLLAPLPEEGDEFSRIMDEIEAQRKKDFWRPFSFDE